MRTEAELYILYEARKKFREKFGHDEVKWEELTQEKPETKGDNDE